MSSNTKNIVSMLASANKTTLYTEAGEVLELKNDGPHDLTRLSRKLLGSLKGTNSVPIDLNDYLIIKTAIVPQGYKQEGIVVTQMVNGQEVQGIFYPSKIQVAVQHEGQEVVIPDVEKLQKHAIRANAENSPAVRNFLRRMAPVVQSRLHSAEDLMNFIERSDLPITNDGLIIGYKKVNQGKKEGTFVDCHSGNIVQRVGSRVWMTVDDVDPSRYRSCSNGLHVANLGYLKGFGGSHTLIVLVDPANFIAVPVGENDKCRVCSYDIIGVMTARGHEMINSGSFVKGEQTFKSVIQDAVAGRHIQPHEAVEVRNQKVASVVTLTGAQTQTAVPLEETTAETKESSGKSLNTDKPLPQKPKQKDILKMAKDKTSTSRNIWDQAPPEVMTVFEDLRQENGSKSAIAALHGTSTRSIGRWQDKYDYEGYVKFKAGNLTVTEQARLFFNQSAFDALAAFKKAKKKSYFALGFTQKEEKQILTATA